MVQRTLEQTIVEKVNASKKTVQEKYFKQFVSASLEFERNEISAKMNALDAVTFDLIKAIRGHIE